MNHVVQVSIMGLVTVQAFYLPWCMVALNVAMGGSPMGDLLVNIVANSPASLLRSKSNI